MTICKINGQHVFVVNNNTRRTIKTQGAARVRDGGGGIRTRSHPLPTPGIRHAINGGGGTDSAGGARQRKGPRHIRRGHASLLQEDGVRARRAVHEQVLVIIGAVIDYVIWCHYYNDLSVLLQRFHPFRPRNSFGQYHPTILLRFVGLVHLCMLLCILSSQGPTFFPHRVVDPTPPASEWITISLLVANQGGPR